MLLNFKLEFHSTFPTLGRASKLSLLSLIGNVLKSAISRQAKASKLSLVLWLNEIVEFHSTFDFVFLLLAQESPSKLGSPFARSSVPTLGRASKLSLLSLIGNVVLVG